MNDDFPPGSSVFDRSYASAWLRKIADDLAAEVLPDLATSDIPEVQRYLEERGLRELRALVEDDALGKRGADALRSMAHAMREYALKRPAMTAETFRHLGEESADQLPAGREFNAIALHILDRQNIRGEAARHALRTLKSLVRGFVLNEMSSSYLDSLEYDHTFELAVDVFIAGLPALAA